MKSLVFFLFYHYYYTCIKKSLYRILHFRNVLEMSLLLVDCGFCRHFYHSSAVVPLNHSQSLEITRKKWLICNASNVFQGKSNRSNEFLIETHIVQMLLL